MPIFQELEVLDHGAGMIDQSEFIEATFRLYQSLPVGDRNDLLNFNVEKKVFEHPDETFKPRTFATKKFDVNSYMQNRYNDDISPISLEAS